MIRRAVRATLVAAAWGAAVAQVGCAGVAYGTAVEPATNGIRYYRPATYVLIQPDYENGRAKVEVVHGPDTDVAYAADPYCYFASNNTKLEFEGGMLKSVTNEADSTRLPKTILEAATALGKKFLEELAKAQELAAAAAMKSVHEQAGEVPVFLFKVTATGFEQIFPPATSSK